MSKFTHHIFVCGKCKPSKHPRGSSKADKPGDLRSALKKVIKRLGLKADVRANDAGCLDQCDDNPVVVIYPQGIWYGRVTADDAERIIERTILQGEILEDLLLPVESLRCGKKASKLSGTPSDDSERNS